MVTSTTAEKNVQEEEKVIPDIPQEIEQEDQLAERAKEGTVASLALRDPTALEAYLASRERALATLHKVAIKTSHPFDWTLYRSRDGKVVGVPRDSGCVTIRTWMGISVFNYRPTNTQGTVEPKIGEVETKAGRVTVVEMWADGHCELTGETVTGVYYALRSDDEFIGRKNRETGEYRLQDMKAACRTGLDTKVTRILSGLRKVPEEVLKEHAINTEQCFKGHGYGTSSDRAASKVADEGVKEGAKKLADEIMKRVGGDKEAARKLLVDITKSEGGNGKKGFKGFTSVDRITQNWQLDNAWEQLRKHEMFGDREPGGDDEKGEAQGRLV